MEKVRPATTYSSIVGQVLAAVRGDTPQGQVAKAVGVTQATWSRIESGKSSFSVEQLSLAATALGIKSHALMERVDYAVNLTTRIGIRVQMGASVGPGYVAISSVEVARIVAEAL